MRTFLLRMLSQGHWRAPEAASLLVELATSEVWGKADRYEVNEGATHPIEALEADKLAARIARARNCHLVVRGDGFEAVLQTDTIAVRRGRTIGAHRFIVAWHMPEGGGEADFEAALEATLAVAEALDLRYAGLTDRAFEADRHLGREVTLSPQYFQYAQRFMVFGMTEVERWGAGFLLDAPAHEVRSLESGHVVLVASPHSLDPAAPEDDTALDALADYLLTHPRAGVLV